MVVAVEIEAVLAVLSWEPGLEGAMCKGVLAELCDLFEQRLLASGGRPGRQYRIENAALGRSGAIFWGGEAIYKNLGRGGNDAASFIAVSSAASIIEVEVPVHHLHRLPLSSGEQIDNRYAHSQGVQSEYGWGTNAKLVTDLPASNMRAITEAGDERFGSLTNCTAWGDPV